MWIAGECHGYDYALLLAAAQLVRITPSHALRICQTDALEKLDYALLRGLGVQVEMVLNDLFYLRTDPHGGAERREWVLIDHCNAIASEFTQFRVAEFDNIHALEPHGALDPSGARKVVHHGEGDRRFAAARFADKSEYLSSRDFKGRAAHCAECPSRR